MTSASLLFEPIAINDLLLPHRIITGPMERGLANRDGTLTHRYIAYLEARAAGGAGLIQLESTYVDPIGMGHLFQAGCHDDLVIEPLGRAADAVHAYGSSLALELYLGGRETPSYMSQRQPIAPSAVSCEVLNPTPMPREMSRQDIDHVISLFCSAARRARSAGVDMVHIHGAHGYLVGSFVSPFSNRRTDEFGGSLENRARFALLLVDALRSELGPGYPIGYRLTADEFVAGGLRIDESSAFAAMLADAGVDLIDVSSGFYESSFMIMQGSESPDGGFVDLARRIKAEVGDSALVSVTQRLSRPGAAERALDAGIDMVSMTRAFHADPEYVNKRRAGQEASITPCIACHHCVDKLEANLVSDCSVNPRSTREYVLGQAPIPAAPTRVVVIGAGPAGLQAASSLAESGSEVTLIERDSQVGGQLNLAASVFSDFRLYVEHANARVLAAGVDVRLDTLASADMVLGLKPELVIVATGARGMRGYFDEYEDATSADLFEAFAFGASPLPSRAVIAGGDWASCVLAIHLARQGSEVSVVEPLASLASDRPGWGREQLLRLMTQTDGIEVLTESTIESIGRDWAQVQSRGQTTRLADVSLVVRGGRQPENSLAEDLQARGTAEVLVIGDALRTRDIHAASLDGLLAAAAQSRVAAALSLV